MDDVLHLPSASTAASTTTKWKKTTPTKQKNITQNKSPPPKKTNLPKKSPQHANKLNPATKSCLNHTKRTKYHLFRFQYCLKTSPFQLLTGHHLKVQLVQDTRAFSSVGVLGMGIISTSPFCTFFS